MYAGKKTPNTKTSNQSPENQTKIILLFLLVPHIMQIHLYNAGHYIINLTTA